MIKGENMTTTKKLNLLKTIAFAIILSMCFALIMQFPIIFKKADAANVEMNYEAVTITNGDFDGSSGTYLQSSPSGWTLQGASTGKYGVIEVSNETFKNSSRTDSFALTSDQNPSKNYDDDDNYVLMLNAKSKKDSDEQNHVGYKSNSITLDAYSFYEISVYVLTQDNARASIYIDGLNDNIDADFERITSSVWREYLFYIATGIDTQTISLELWLGSKTQNSSNAVFFDHVSAKKTSGSYYYNMASNLTYKLALSTSTAEQEDLTRKLENKNVIDLRDFEANVIENADFENGQSLTSPIDGWSAVKQLTTDANSSIISVNYKESMTTLGVENLKSSLSENNNYTLLMYAKNKTNFGYKSSSFELYPYETYKITVWAKVSSDIDGNAYAKLVEEDDVKDFYNDVQELDFYTPKTSSITISSNTTNKLTNDYTAYSFYVKGHELYKTKMHLELWLGSEDSDASGAVAFDDITFEKVSWTQFNNASSTNTQTLTLTTIENSPSVSNGTFDNASDVEYSDVESASGEIIKKIKYPVTPASWTITQEDELKGVIGIVNTYAPIYDENRAYFGNAINPNNPSNAGNVNYDVNNVLMIYNQQSTYQQVTSETLTVSKQTYQKISFDYKTVEQTANSTKLMNVYVLDSNENIIYEDLGIYSSEWTTYEILIKSSEYSDSIKLVISLGSEDSPVKGFLYVDNVAFASDDAMTDEKYVEYANAHKTIEFTITNFNFFSNEILYNSGMYTPFKYTQSLDVGTNPTSGDPIAYGGIIDGKEIDGEIGNIYNISNSENNENTLKYMPAIKVNGKATYSLTNKDQISLQADSYYKFSVEVYTRFFGDTDQSNVSDEEKIEYGAIFALSELDQSFTQIVSNDKWTTYTIYVATTDEKDVSLKFGLSSSDNNVQGLAFFDNFKFETIDETEYSKGKIYAENDKTILLVSKTDTENDDSDKSDSTDDSTNDTVIWYLIPSVILFVALIIAVAAYFMKKVTIKKWEKKKASEYDRNSTLYRDVVRREAEKIRDNRIKELNAEIDEIEQEIERIEQIHKENAKVQRTSTGNISMSQERDFKAYAKRHTALENQIESLKGKIDNMNMPEYLLSIQRNIILEKVRKEKQAKDEKLKKEKLEKKKQKLLAKQNKNK